MDAGCGLLVSIGVLAACSGDEPPGPPFASEVVVLVDGQDRPGLMAADADAVYWATLGGPDEQSNLFVLETGATSPRELGAIDFLHSLRVTRDNVLYVEIDRVDNSLLDDVVRAVDRSTGEPRPLFLVDGDLSRLAAEGQEAAWAADGYVDHQEPRVSAIFRCDLETGEVTQVAPAGSDVTEVVVDGEAVYWMEATPTESGSYQTGFFRSEGGGEVEQLGATIPESPYLLIHDPTKSFWRGEGSSVTRSTRMLRTDNRSRSHTPSAAPSTA